MKYRRMQQSNFGLPVTATGCTRHNTYSICIHIVYSICIHIVYSIDDNTVIIILPRIIRSMGVIFNHTV